jgi:laminin alpha 1/2
VASSPPPAPSNGTTTRYSLAHGVEWCQCPSEYASASCQDPARGFYRRYKHDYLTSSVWIDWVGEAARCQCSGRSEACDRETGRCIGCRENTAGDRCQLCAAGFYGDPSQPGGCKPCSCPTQERNFAESCRVVVSQQQQQQWSCSCQRGYSGERCQRCDYGYYGQPTQGIPCQPCHCNVNGSVSDECHELTGQCNCKQGITGRDCTYCAPRHVISPDGCTCNFNWILSPLPHLV